MERATARRQFVAPMDAAHSPLSASTPFARGRFANIAPTMANILVVDPDPRRRAHLRGVLEGHGFGVVEAEQVEPQPERAEQKAGLGAFDPSSLAVVVANAPSGDSLGLLSSLHPVPVILLAQDATIGDAVSAVREGAADYLAWPGPADALVAAVRRAATTPRAGGQTDQGGDEWPMFGACPAMLDLFERIHAAARTDAAVLVRGESGTGKELVARALHSRSQRRHAPLISLNCAAVPEPLIEPELFGHPGADGANPATPGLVGTARAGTLFLDEVDELPLPAQHRLLQVLGAGVERTADVRVIAATQRNLELLVEHGQFRADLLAVLAGITLQVPALRDRGGDAPSLAQILARRAAGRLGKPEPRFSADALDAIERYHWPGNVRELEHAVERAAILADRGEIQADLLGIDASPREVVPAPPPPQEDAVSLEEYFVRFVTEHQDQYTETELATKLGISRKNLWERRKRHGIPRRRTRKRGPRREPG